MVPAALLLGLGEPVTQGGDPRLPSPDGASSCPGRARYAAASTLDAHQDLTAVRQDGLLFLQAGLDVHPVSPEADSLPSSEGAE